MIWKKNRNKHNKNINSKYGNKNKTKVINLN